MVPPSPPVGIGIEGGENYVFLNVRSLTSLLVCRSALPCGFTFLVGLRSLRFLAGLRSLRFLSGLHSLRFLAGFRSLRFLACQRFFGASPPVSVSLSDVNQTKCFPHMRERVQRRLKLLDSYELTMASLTTIL